MDQETTLVVHQVFLEKLYNKNQTNKRVAEYFLHNPGFDFAKHIVEGGVDLDFGISLLVQIALHKQADLKTMVGVMRHHLDDSQASVDMLVKCLAIGLLDWNFTTRRFVVLFDIPQHVQDELDRFQYPLPMVVKPMTVTHNKESGYLTSGGSLILKNNHHEDDICLDHINRMNAVRLTIDTDTATMIHNQWRNMDRIKDGETHNDFERRKRAFNKYDLTAKDVISTVNMYSDTVHLTHKYDKRGRTYCQGYHVSYQGNAWNKSVIQLADKEMVA